MSTTIQQFLAASTRKAASDLTEAYLALSVDRREWNPGGNARSAVDMVAECALNNRYTAELLKTGKFTAGGPDLYAKEKRAVAAEGWDTLKALLDKNTEIVIDVILNTQDSRFTEELSLPWGKSALTEILTYPFWNMTYHLGQINAIGMQLEVSK